MFNFKARSKKPEVPIAVGQYFKKTGNRYTRDDGSLPTLKEFTQHGFDVPTYVLAVHGQRQADLAKRLTQRFDNKRQSRQVEFDEALICINQRQQEEKKPKVNRMLYLDSCITRIPFWFNHFMANMSAQLTRHAFQQTMAFGHNESSDIPIYYQWARIKYGNKSVAQPADHDSHLFDKIEYLPISPTTTTRTGTIIDTMDYHRGDF